MAVTKSNKHSKSSLRSKKAQQQHKADNSDAFNVLLSAAVALPGISSAPLSQAQDTTRSDDIALSYNHAEYKESGNRMEVDIDQLSITIPIASRYELGINAVRDVTSGASPVIYVANPNERPIAVLQAGASIKDTRDAFDISGSYYGDTFKISSTVGRSEEDDYKAKFAGIEYSHYFNQKNTIFSASYSQSNDDVSNVYFAPNTPSFDPFLDPTVVRKRKQKDIHLSIEQVLSKNSRGQLGIAFINADGSLSDPYKRVFLEGQSVGGLSITIPDFFKNGGTAEQLEDILLNSLGVSTSPALRAQFGFYDDTRPNERKQIALLSSYSHYIGIFDAGLHFDYRYSDDDWGANSHTIDLSWRQALPWGIILTPSIRYYTQDNADFYYITLERLPADGFYSSDYRLAGFGANAWKLDIEKTFIDKLTVSASFESYQRKFSEALKESSRGDAIDDYDYDLLSVSFTLLL